MIDDNFFDEFFGGTFDISAKENNLNAYWQQGKVAEYYDLLNQTKQQGYKVLRNSAGKHRVIEGT